MSLSISSLVQDRKWLESRSLEQLQALAILKQRGELDNPAYVRVRSSPPFAEFIRHVFPGYEFARFHQFLVAKLEAFLLAIERQESPRLALSVPPRHGKSQCASILLPAYALGRNPDWPIIHASYTADLSHDFSRAVRNLLMEEEYQQLFPGIHPPRDSRSVERWGIAGHRGAFVSTGVGGPLMGRGARLLLIDDPLKNSADADSEVFRTRQRNWYATTARTRLEKGAGILIIQTRWHLEDLTGYVTTGAGSDEPAAEEWEVVNIPAVAGEDDPLGRAPGEALWPEKYDLAALDAMRRQMPPRWWQALMQGTPVAAEGNFFEVGKIAHRFQPEGLRIYQAWDLAISEKTTADYTVGVTIGINDDKDVYLLDVRRGRWAFNAGLVQIAAAAEVWSPVSIGIESNGFQSAVFQEASRRYVLPFREVKADRDKQVRAQLLADRIAMGKVFANKQSAWWREFETEMLAFPSGAHDDQVDAASHAVRMVSLIPWGQDPIAVARLKARLTGART